jgi:hypothetical protein
MWFFSSLCFLLSCAAACVELGLCCCLFAFLAVPVAASGFVRLSLALCGSASALLRSLSRRRNAHTPAATGNTYTHAHINMRTTIAALLLLALVAPTAGTMRPQCPLSPARLTVPLESRFGHHCCALAAAEPCSDHDTYHVLCVFCVQCLVPMFVRLVPRSAVRRWAMKLCAPRCSSTKRMTMMPLPSPSKSMSRDSQRDSMDSTFINWEISRRSSP